MRKVFPFIAISFSLLTFFLSCSEYRDDYSSIVSSPETFDSINVVLSNLKNRNIEKQTFEFNNQNGTNFTGNGNIKVIIQPHTITDSLGNDINIDLVGHLTEYNTPKEMFYGGVYTESNGQLLVTGGSFHFYVTDTDGNMVDMDRNLIQSVIPIQTDVTGYENDLVYFTGTQTNVDNNQQIVNWVPAEAEASFSQNEEGGPLLNIYQTYLGYSNCDALMNIPADQRTQFKVGFSTNNEDITVQEKTAFMFVNDFPSVINIYTVDGEYLKAYENTIPMGLNGTLLGIAIDSEGHLMVGSTDITVAGDDIFNIDLDYSTTEALENLIVSITE